MVETLNYLKISQKLYGYHFITLGSIRYLENGKKKISGFEDNWQTKNFTYEEMKKKNFANYGVVGDEYNIIIDLDKGPHFDKLKEKLNILPETLTDSTPTGGLHAFFYCKDGTQGRRLKHNAGEIRARGMMVIGPDSKTEDGRGWHTIKNKPVAVIESKQIEEAFGEYLTEPLQDIEKTKSITRNLPKVDRSAEEFGLLCRYIKEGKNKEQCFAKMQVMEKWKEKPASYREMTYNKALAAVNKEPKQNSQRFFDKGKKNDWNEKPLEFIDSKSLMETPKERGFVIDKMIGKGSKVATVAPSGSFKTIITLTQAICIANGKTFLGYKTKKQGVAFLEMEMGRQDMMRNVNRIFKGLELRRKKYPVFFLLKEGDLSSSIFIKKLKDFITKNKIGLVIFDSLIRYTSGEENSAKDMNAIYQAFVELQQDTKVAIDFLHHLNKGGGIRGSTDIKAQVDTVYEIKRKGKSGRFTIVNLKNRNGEINDINGEIFFTEDMIKIERCEEKTEEEAAENYSKFQIARAFILDFAKASCPTETHCFSRAELLIALEAWNADNETKISKRLIDSTLKHLATKVKALRKGDKIGEYYLNNADNEKIARWIEPIGLGNALNTEPLQTTKNREVA